MMWDRRKNDLERKERAVQRAERETAAGKLLARVPRLASISLVIDEKRPEGCVSDTHYIRRVVVEHAPALFEVPCSDRGCQDGGYEITREILAALASSRLEFQGEHACGGRVGTLDCARVLRYKATATYAELPRPAVSESAGAA